MLRRVLPDVDISTVAMHGVPRSARWVDPFAWRFQAAGADERVFVARRGRLRRETDVVPHERVQSARLTQGPLQRRLGLASIHLDTTPGPVRPTAAHRGAAEARRLLDAEVERARLARSTRATGTVDEPPRTPAAPYGCRVSAPLELTDPAFVDDPYPVFARLREQSRLLWHEPTSQWLTLTYALSNAVLRDRRMGRLWRDKQPDDRFEPFNRLHRHQMMENEPPDHTRLRSLVTKAFARGHIERLRPRVQQIADDLLDRAMSRDGFDLIADYAEPLPVLIIAELLGVPEADHHLLRPWSAAIVKMYEYDRGPDVEPAAVSASAEFYDYMRDLARVRRGDPRDDLVSHLAAVEDGGERLSADELVASAILLLNAGHEASVNAFGNGMVALLRHPDQLERLRADESLVPSAIEEMIRFDSPLQLFERTAQTEVELGDVTVPTGRQGGGPARSGQPRPGRVPRPRQLRHRPPSQPAHRLRRGAAPLHRGAAGPDGAADLAADAAEPLPDPRARGRSGPPVDVRAARLRVGPRPRLTDPASTGARSTGS